MTSSILFKNARFKPYHTIGFIPEVSTLAIYKESKKSKPVRNRFQIHKAKIRKAKIRKAKKIQAVKWGSDFNLHFKCRLY